MGALHRGHRVLLERGRELAGSNGFLVVSVFVNPTQFAPGEDFSRYPRTLALDRELCHDAGVDLMFTPSASQIYGEGYSTFVEESALSGRLCGQRRPGHFRGVCTVLAKLFNLTAPDVAIFGCKDRQQLAVVQRMVRDLHYPVRIIGVKTVRDPDGLALSSRNRFLSLAERAEAPLLRETLLALRSLCRGGERRGNRLKAVAKQMIAQSVRARVDYIEIVDPENLQPTNTVVPGSIAALAVFFGKTRLIDNIDL